MRDIPLILIVDDQPDNRRLLNDRLVSQGYATAFGCDGPEALDQVYALKPDLILLDVMMPGMDGFEVCRRLRNDADLPFIPIILVTAKSDGQDLVDGLEAGANDYLTKPVQQSALTARVRSMLRTKALHDQVEEQRLQLADLNAALERKVAAQVAVIERANRLRRFLPRNVADQILSAHDDTNLLGSKREKVAVLFADLRGFTAYAEQHAPEIVMADLNAFHRYVGPLIEHHNGTLERFLGDGIVVLFNAPLPCADPMDCAARLAKDIRAEFTAAIEMRPLSTSRLGIGIGIAFGEATLGQIGYEGRLDYAAIGPVCNLAARLCDKAADSQILASGEAVELIRHRHHVLEIGSLPLKGIAEPVVVFEVN